MATKELNSFTSLTSTSINRASANSVGQRSPTPIHHRSSRFGPIWGVFFEERGSHAARFASSRGSIHSIHRPSLSCHSLLKLIPSQPLFVVWSPCAGCLRLPGIPKRFISLVWGVLCIIVVSLLCALLSFLSCSFLLCIPHTVLELQHTYTYKVCSHLIHRYIAISCYQYQHPHPTIVLTAFFLNRIQPSILHGPSREGKD
jgi:hypothetical protein